MTEFKHTSLPQHLGRHLLVAIGKEIKKPSICLMPWNVMIDNLALAHMAGTTLLQVIFRWTPCSLDCPHTISGVYHSSRRPKISALPLYWQCCLHSCIHITPHFIEQRWQDPCRPLPLSSVQAFGSEFKTNQSDLKTSNLFLKKFPRRKWTSVPSLGGFLNLSFPGFI